MLSKKIARLGLLFVLPIALQASALPEPKIAPETKILADRARYWSQQGKTDLAAYAWQELLRAEPDNTEALTGMALYEAQNGNKNAANSYLIRLKKINKTHPGSSQAALGRDRVLAPTPLAVQQDAKAGQDDIWADFIQTDLNTTAPQDELSASSAQGGSLLTSDNPSKQELEDRVKYWDTRGRSDLAAKARHQLELAEPKDAPGDDKPLTAGRRLASDDSPALPGTLENGQASTEPSRQELEERAKYWEARGRSDLADPIRQKLQPTEPDIASKPDPASNTAARISRDALHASPPPVLPVAKVLDNQDITKSALEDSLLKNPKSLRARLDLAQLYRNAGELALARAQIESVLAYSPDLPEALYASAQLYAEQHLWPETLHTLEKISPISRTANMAMLQKTTWSHVQIDRADALVRQGNSAEAEILLRQVAAELAANYNQTVSAEPPPLWKSAAAKKRGGKR